MNDGAASPPSIPPGVYGPEQLGQRYKLASDLKPGDVIREKDDPSYREEVASVQLIVRTTAFGVRTHRPDDPVWVEVPQ